MRITSHVRRGTLYVLRLPPVDNGFLLLGPRRSSAACSNYQRAYQSAPEARGPSEPRLAFSSTFDSRVTSHVRRGTLYVLLLPPVDNGFLLLGPRRSSAACSNYQRAYQSAPEARGPSEPRLAFSSTFDMRITSHVKRGTLYVLRLSPVDNGFLLLGPRRSSAACNNYQRA
jgi:ABC-type uncharacterized transport system permease subunit